MNYKEYRQKYQPKFQEDVLMGYLISEPISFIFNKLFYRDNLIPNRISFLMFLSGVIGALLFFTPFKIAGFFFMHLWFIFDAWDGAVARQTKMFSKYGKEFDYFVHTIVHPLFFLGLGFSIEPQYKIIIIIYLVLNLVKRALYNIDIHSNEEHHNKKINLYIFVFHYCRGVFSDAPNYILIAPLFLIFGKDLFLSYFTIPFILSEIILILMIIRQKINVYLQ